MARQMSLISVVAATGKSLFIFSAVGFIRKEKNIEPNGHLLGYKPLCMWIYPLDDDDLLSFVCVKGQQQQLRGASQSRKKRLLQASELYTTVINNSKEMMGSFDMYKPADRQASTKRKKYIHHWCWPAALFILSDSKSYTTSSQFLFPAKNNRKRFPFLVSLYPLTHQ